MIRLGCLFLLLTCLLTLNAQKREMRGAWIATVANIDWPSKRDVTSEVQKQEMTLLLDSLHNCGVNAVFFQVRPTADALYRSTIEPWSEWLTGEQGRAPQDSLFDPLEYVVREAHRRCMEVHAWVNPYRVTNYANAKLVSNHLFYKRPELFIKYGDRIIFDPGKDETAEYLLTVIKDVVNRYDIDGIHLDDYFYPYPISGKDFPDENTFKEHPNGFKNKADWRRDNVNRVMSRLHDTIKAYKPWVEFGVSPFGVWRNKSQDSRGSDTKAGCTNYDDLYADVLLWAERGWVDYVAPQLYWEIGKKVADYSVLAPWWRKNITGCKLYFGLYVSGLEVNRTPAWRAPNEVIRQMQYNKECVDIDGEIFYSTHYILRNPQGLLDSLKNSYFVRPALTPVTNGGAEAIFPVDLKLNNDTLSWKNVVADEGEAISYYVVYAFPDSMDCDFEETRNIVAVTADTSLDLSKYEWGGNVYTLTVTAVNRFRRESEPYEFVPYRKKESARDFPQ